MVSQKPIYYLLQSSKHFIAEAVIQKFFPYLLDEFISGIIRWNVKQLYVFPGYEALLSNMGLCTLSSRIGRRVSVR